MEILMKMLMDPAPLPTSAPPRVSDGTVYYDGWFAASLAGSNEAMAYINGKATMDPRQFYATDDPYGGQNAFLAPFFIEPNQLARTPNPPKPSEAADQDARELAVIENYLLGTP